MRNGVASVYEGIDVTTLMAAKIDTKQQQQRERAPNPNAGPAALRAATATNATSSSSSAAPAVSVAASSLPAFNSAYTLPDRPTANRMRYICLLFFF
jgi:flagellar biosynthesis/type III secretory pathway M-ring protein FliF/YscJ